MNIKAQIHLRSSVMESKGTELFVSVELDLSDDDVLSSLAAFEAQHHIVERDDKKREETKPAPQKLTRREELLKEDKWLKEMANRLGARRYGAHCAIERLTIRIEQLLRKRTRVLKELETLEK